MLSAVIRPAETTTIEVAGDSLADIYAKLSAQAPAGFDLAKAPMIAPEVTVITDVGFPVTIIKTMPPITNAAAATNITFEMIRLLRARLRSCAACSA